MMNETEAREIREAISSADNALTHLYSARKYLDSAGNWGLLDMFGGGLISGMMKHSKMGDAEREIENARYALQSFSKELRDVSGYSSIHIDDFLTFADFFFDGLVADIMVQSKISEGKRQCDEAIHRVEGIKVELQEKLRGM
ncbi:hypothetical protein SAMN02910453_0679 [Lachnospiraceae bacterium A10]|jgi:hypothetical protein|nr:hypothetical protein SAMN02910453_0679 [Lachnospiraceae bacterium A10]